MIHFGIVGVGGFGTIWRRVLAKLHDEGRAQIAAAAERDVQAQAETLSALRAAGSRTYTSLTEMIGREGDHLQIIGLPVGIPWHAPLAVEALEAGYPVLVEKPLAATVQEAARIQDAARRSGLTCEVAYQFMYSPTIQQLAARVQSGTLGRVLAAKSVTGWPRPASYYARNRWAGTLGNSEQWVLDGPATNGMAHHLMNMLYLGACVPGTAELASIVSVQAELYHAKPIESYDTSSMRVRLSNGVEIVHNLSHAISAESLEPVIDLRLTSANVHWEAASDTATIDHADGRQEKISNPAPQDIHDLPLRHMVATVGGQSSLPGPTYHCTTDLAARQVLAVNLAFESSRQVYDIGQQYCHVDEMQHGDALVAVKDMLTILQEAHAKGCLLSELDLPWTIGTSPVQAAGYDVFPQHFGMP